MDKPWTYSRQDYGVYSTLVLVVFYINVLREKKIQQANKKKRYARCFLLIFCKLFIVSNILEKKYAMFDSNLVIYHETFTKVWHKN